jgi:hypothetical protein
LKEIKKDKLVKILNAICDDSVNLRIRDIENIINEYGDEWFISDGVYSLCNKGKEFEMEGEQCSR